MRHEEMIGKVQALARLPGRGAAEGVTRAVLLTLAERLPGGVAEHVAAQLPADIGAVMREAPESARVASPVLRTHTSGEQFGLAVFAGRVAARSGTTEEVALRETAAVFEVLDAALAPGLMTKVAQELPKDIGQLLPAKRATGEAG
jgi:uncharacterized protein (DUF2267 family)